MDVAEAEEVTSGRRNFGVEAEGIGSAHGNACETCGIFESVAGSSGGALARVDAAKRRRSSGRNSGRGAGARPVARPAGSGVAFKASCATSCDGSDKVAGIGARRIYVKHRRVGRVLDLERRRRVCSRLGNNTGGGIELNVTGASGSAQNGAIGGGSEADSIGGIGATLDGNRGGRCGVADVDSTGVGATKRQCTACRIE